MTLVTAVVATFVAIVPPVATVVPVTAVIPAIMMAVAVLLNVVHSMIGGNHDDWPRAIWGGGPVVLAPAVQHAEAVVWLRAKRDADTRGRTETTRP
jgi:hypothetical protein